ncbi:DNA polymerase IV 2 [Striga asiatica]|uniref:DNA polymerase IV 2 n=1 Tax=Striga asiatica TaxID=4170 RepID=A0A5A7QQU3_STRAF|nr:DNA polymerase IV 2 [Striga asiatica]
MAQSTKTKRIAPQYEYMIASSKLTDFTRECNTLPHDFRPRDGGSYYAAKPKPNANVPNLPVRRKQKEITLSKYGLSRSPKDGSSREALKKHGSDFECFLTSEGAGSTSTGASFAEKSSSVPKDQGIDRLQYQYHTNRNRHEYMNKERQKTQSRASQKRQCRRQWIAVDPGSSSLPNSSLFRNSRSEDENS